MSAVNLTRMGLWVIGLCVVEACSGDPVEPKASDSTDATDGTSKSTTHTSFQTSPSGTTGSNQDGSSSTPHESDDASTQGSSAFVVELMWDDLTYPCTLRDGGNVIYTCDRRQFLGQPSRILALPKNGGAPTTVVEVERADGVAINDSLWVLNSRDDLLTRFALDSGQVQDTVQVPSYMSTLFSTPLGVFGASIAGVTWYTAGTGYGISLWDSGGIEEVWLLAVAQSTLYFSVNPPYPADPGSPYKVMKVDVDLNSGASVGAPMQLAGGIGSARGIDVTAEAVIFADHENGKVYSVPLSGGNPSVLADVPYPWSVGVNSTHVYIATRPDTCTTEGGVYRVPVGGGMLETIADNQICPSNVLVTADAVYWLNAGPEQPDGDPAMVSGSYSTVMRSTL